MKVLIFMTQFYRLSGAERLAVELAEELNKRDIHADILSMYTEDLSGVSVAKKELLERGIPNVYFLGMNVHPSISSMVPAILRLRSLIREQEYDIVETSMLSPTVLAAWATRGTRARHIAGLHRVFRRDRENTRQHKFFRFSVRCNPRIRYYSISDYVNDRWIKYSKTLRHRSRRIYNAIPDDCFTVTPNKSAVCKELGIPECERLAIYVGRLAAFKKIDTLLESLGPVLDKQRINLLYVGSPDLHARGTAEVLQHMEQRILREGWTKRVKFLGYRKDVPRLISSSDIMVHPTEIEGFGLVLVEAMAAGIPVVASNVEGIPEILAGTDSIMVPPNDTAALREAVLRTLNRPDGEAAQAVNKGRRRAEDFRISTRTDEMVNLFNEVLQGQF